MKEYGKYVHCLLYIATALVLVMPAHAENIQIKVELFPENGSSKRNSVTLLLKGETYPTNAWFDKMVTTASTSPDERFIIDSVNINTNGTLADVKKLWTVDEQNTSFFSDPDVFARSQSIFKRITSAAFLAKILYSNYEIFIVQFNVEGYGSMVNEYPVKKQGGRFFLTNYLSKDPVFLYLSQKYAKTLPLKQR